MLHLAESIGKQIAQGRVPTWSDLTWLPESGYTYIHTKPYKEIENALGLWQGFLRNFANSSKPIYLISTGNSQEIRLIIGFPTDQINYAESLFFAHFPTSDWLDSKFDMPEHVRFLNFGESKVCSDADFTKNGLYADPRKDVLSLYESIPAENQLHIINRVVFNKKKGFFEKLIKNVKEVKNLMPEKADGEKPKEEKKPPEDATATIKFSTGWAIDGPHSLRDLVEGKVKAVYTKYLVSGTMKIGNNSQIVQLNMNQVINFFHFPTKEFTSTILSVSGYRKLPAPTRIPTLENVENKNDLTVLGYTEYKSNPKMFGIKREDKLRHMYIIGMTGTGKSKFIANMVRSDMISNKGVCVMDPHGDLIDDILSQVPSYRTNDVVLFDVADRDFPVGFNVFECDSDEQKPLIASGIVGIFKKMFGNSWGPRLEYILRNVIFALLEYPGATFLDLIRMLTDDNYKEEILSHVKDPIILKFWRDEYDKYQPKQREEAVAPITNKVGQFTSSTIVRNIFGQSRTKMKFRQMMDEGKIILVNLSKGKIGEDSMAMIGSFIASKIQIDAMSRADIDESQRKDFYLYIDEFQNFATESFASILSEARKYKLSLIVANQYISQIDEPIRNAIFGNVGTIIGNRIGKDDAEIMAGQFKGMVTTNDFLSLPNQRCYIKLMIDGMVSDPFSMKTAQFVKYEDFQVIKEKVREQSRQRYAMPRQELETLMQVWANKKFTMAEKIAEKAAAEGKAWAGGSPASAGYPAKGGPAAGPAVPPVKQGPVSTTPVSPVAPKTDIGNNVLTVQNPTSTAPIVGSQASTQSTLPTPPAIQEIQKIEPIAEIPKPQKAIKKDLGPIMAMPYPADKPVEISSLKPIQKKVENKAENKTENKDSGKLDQQKNLSGKTQTEDIKNKTSEVKIDKNNEQKSAVSQKDIFKKPTIHDIIYANPEEKIELPIVETIKEEKIDVVKPDTITKKVEETTGEVVEETTSPEPKKRGRPKKVVVEESGKDAVPTVEDNIGHEEQEDVRSLGSAPLHSGGQQTENEIQPKEQQTENHKVIVEDNVGHEEQEDVRSLGSAPLHSVGQQTENEIQSGGQDIEILRSAQDDGSQIQDDGSQIQPVEHQQPEAQQQDDYVPRDGSEGFSIKNVKLGEWYNGYVKLMYNYGIFVTVLGVEGLIHKKNIRELHPDISRKKIYNIGDPIRVKAEEFTEVNGEKRVIWTQMGDDF